jgi:hypothetical protein
MTAPHSRTCSRDRNTTWARISANASSSTRIGCTSAMGPVASATAWQRNPTMSAAIPPSQSRRWASRQSIMIGPPAWSSGRAASARRCSTEATALPIAARTARTMLSIGCRSGSSRGSAGTDPRGVPSLARARSKQPLADNQLLQIRATKPSAPRRPADESATARAGSRGHERNHSCAHSHPAGNAHAVQASCAGAEPAAAAGTADAAPWTADTHARASTPGSGTRTAHPDATTDTRPGTGADTTHPTARPRTRTHTTHPTARPRTGV